MCQAQPLAEKHTAVLLVCHRAEYDGDQHKGNNHTGTNRQLQLRHILHWWGLYSYGQTWPREVYLVGAISGVSPRKSCLSGDQEAQGLLTWNGEGSWCKRLWEVEWGHRGTHQRMRETPTAVSLRGEWRSIVQNKLGSGNQTILSLANCVSV